MATRWSMEEESLLERLNQRSFWNNVVERFNDQTNGPHRTKNSIRAEWSRINHECRRYNHIYKELLRTSEDPCRLSNANRIYYERYGRGIYYQHVWFILRNTWVWDRDDE